MMPFGSVLLLLGSRGQLEMAQIIMSVDEQSTDTGVDDGTGILDCRPHRT
jgi:hypothetical protein